MNEQTTSGMADDGEEVEFGTITVEEVERGRKQVKSGGAFFTWEEGYSTIRLLPAAKGQAKPWVIYHQHFLDKYLGGQDALRFVCRQKSGQGRCPGCERHDQLMQSKNTIDKTRAKDWKPKARVLTPGIDRKDEESGVQIFAYGAMVYKGMGDLLTDAQVYGRDFTNPLDGADLVVKKYKEDGYYKYKVAIRPADETGDHKLLAQTREQRRKWCDARPDLSIHTMVPSYAEIVEMEGKLRAAATGRTYSPPAATAQPAVQAPASSPAPISPPTGGFDAGGTVEGEVARDQGVDDDIPF